ncbi:MAG: alpha/beta fold hydrolase [Chitinophagaceae bacterium]|nr:alpha/beta fold hydrolase [Chitinophagaceae bacterium]
MIDNRQPTGKINKKIIFRWIKIIVFIYCIVGMGLYFLQEKLLFHPKKLPAGYAYNFNFPFKEINIPISKTENLSLVKFFPADTFRKGVVLYFHGNMENINHYAIFAKNFTRLGYEVWMPDYPGYGKSSGILSEKELYEEALQVYKLAHTTFSAGNIIIFGKSLGSGIAAELASVKDCRRLILETPYYSIPELFNTYAPIYPTSYISKFKIPTYQYIQDVHAPIAIFHGTDDELIPFYSSLKLRQYLHSGDTFIVIQHGKHNNLNESLVFHKNLDSLLQ